MNGFYPEGCKSNCEKAGFSLQTLIEAKAQGCVLEAPVLMCDASHNLIVDLGCMKGIIPRSEGAIGIDDGSTRDIALISRVGKTVCFTVSEILTQNPKPHALLSRKNAQELCLRHIKTECHSGDIVDAKIQIDGEIDASNGYVYTTAGGAEIISSGTGVAKVKA